MLSAIFRRRHRSILASSRAEAAAAIGLSRRGHARFVALPDRKTVRVAGPDAATFLQGLVTNDMEHLVPMEEDATEEDEGDEEVAAVRRRRSMYCMFLNHSGRIVFDAMVFRASDETDAAPEFLLDVDAVQAPKLVKHLKLYKVRKKVKIEPAVDLRTAVMFNSVSAEEATPEAQIDLPGSVFCDNNLELKEQADLDVAADIVESVDPRVAALGRRLIGSESSLMRCCSSIERGDAALFSQLRHHLGVCEGSDEIPSGKCFPLEYNADYMHGVSFHKGCYVGQELTARTHHTGVVRKRIMPVRLEDAGDTEGDTFELDTDFLNEKGKKIGKLRAWSGGGFGLALMRVAESLEAEEILLGGSRRVAVQKPLWWPKGKEAPKKSAKKSNE